LVEGEVEGAGRYGCWFYSKEICMGAVMFPFFALAVIVAQAQMF